MMRILDVLIGCAIILALVAICEAVGRLSPEQIAQREDEHRVWCNSNYHRYPECPKYGKFRDPWASHYSNDPDHLAWCGAFGGGDCPNH